MLKWTWHQVHIIWMSCTNWSSSYTQGLFLIPKTHICKNNKMRTESLPTACKKTSVSKLTTYGDTCHRSMNTAVILKETWILRCEMSLSLLRLRASRATTSCGRPPSSNLVRRSISAARESSYTCTLQTPHKFVHIFDQLTKKNKKTSI